IRNGQRYIDKNRFRNLRGNRPLHFDLQNEEKSAALTETGQDKASTSHRRRHSWLKEIATCLCTTKRRRLFLPSGLRSPTRSSAGWSACWASDLIRLTVGYGFAPPMRFTPSACISRVTCF